MNPTEPFVLVIPPAVREELVEHARRELPNESCGFLAGRITNRVATASHYHSLVNELKSPTAFATEPRSVLQAFRRMRTDGTELLAVVHSHPTSDPIPSKYDLAQNTYGPHTPWVIVGLADSEADVRVWWLGENSYRPHS